MALGPGKFDDLATLVREQAGADAVIVIVFGAPAGNGFAIQATPKITANLPTLLRIMADDIERAMQDGT